MSLSRNRAVPFALALAAALVVALPFGVAAEPNPLVAPDERRVTLPLAAGGAGIEIDVSRSDSEPLPPSEIAVAVLSVAGPHGEAMSTGAIVAGPIREGAGGTAIVPLRIDEPSMWFPGTYTARVRLLEHGAGREGSARIVNLIINSPTAVLDAQSLNARITSLTRPWPWSAVDGDVHLSISPEPARPLEEIAVSVRELRSSEKPRDSTSASTPNQVSALVPSGPVVSITSFSPRLSAGATGEIVVHVAALENVGSFATDVILRASTLDGSAVIPLTVTVSDHWLFPTLVILLGVLGGFGVNQLRNNWRPAQESRLRLLRLGQRIEELSAAARDAGPALAQQHEALRSALADATSTLDDGGDIAAALTAAEAKLEALRTALSDAAKPVLAGIVAQREEANAFRAADYMFTEAQRTELIRINEELAAAEAFAGSLRVGSADARQKAAAEALDRLQQAVVRNWAETLRQDWNAKKSQPPSVDGELVRAVDAVAKPPIGPDQIREALTELEKAEKDLVVRPLGAVSLLHAATTPDMAPPEPRIVSAEPLRALAPIQFKMANSAGNVQGAVTWDFGDGAPAEAGDADAVHIYTAPGAYVVTATAQGRSRRLLSVDIRASNLEQQRVEIRKRLRSADLATSLIAAVLATGLGLQQLWVGKLFGSPLDYFFAFAWGFGIDQTVQGVAGVLSKVRGGTSGG